MAKVVVTLTQDWRKIAELAGGDPDENMFDPPTSELEVPGVTQAALDTGFADYVADQTNIDAATQAARNTVSRESEKSSYDSRRIMRAIVEALIDEINTLRSLHSLPDRTVAQARTAIRNKIDNL